MINIFHTKFTFFLTLKVLHEYRYAKLIRISLKFHKSNLLACDTTILEKIESLGFKHVNNLSRITVNVLSEERPLWSLLLVNWKCLDFCYCLLE